MQVTMVAGRNTIARTQALKDLRKQNHYTIHKSMPCLFLCSFRSPADIV